jgi:predicted AAA+ superfamily ATPase
MRYRARVVDQQISRALSVMGGVLIEGIRACGKTESGRHFAKSEARLDIDNRMRDLAEISPKLVLEGQTPRLIDEWQVVPELWNLVRHEIDDRQLRGQFILAGSTRPTDDITRHSGAGRMARIRMRPMSLQELGLSNGSVSVESLLNGEAPEALCEEKQLTDIVEIIVRGGWPAAVDLPLADAQFFVSNYVRDLMHVDINQITDRQRSVLKISSTLHSIARNIATPLNFRTLTRDTSGGREASSNPVGDEHTVKEYVNLLDRLMVVENQPAWDVHLRAPGRIQKSPKLHFVDPSLASAILRAKPESLLQDLNFLGLLFESAVTRDLRIYADSFTAGVFHYRVDGDRKRETAGLEVDAIVDAGDTRWAAFEVKLGARDEILDKAAANLVNFSKKIDTSKSTPPASLNIITGLGAYAYQRKDGVNVVPIGALGP